MSPLASPHNFEFLFFMPMMAFSFPSLVFSLVFPASAILFLSFSNTQSRPNYIPSIEFKASSRFKLIKKFTNHYMKKITQKKSFNDGIMSEHLTILTGASIYIRYSSEIV